MKTRDTHSRRPLTAVLAGKVRLALLLYIAVSVIAFGLALDRVLRTRGRAFLIEQARLCAAALVPGQNGDLSEAVSDLRDRYEGLIAVATLDACGNLHTVYPERPAHRRAILAVLADIGKQVPMSSPDTGESLNVSGVVVPLNGSESPVARQAMFLLRDDWSSKDVLGVIATIGVLLGVAGLIGAQWMRRWFDCHVTRPLRDLAAAVTTPCDQTGELPRLERGRWHETADIADRFDELLKSIVETGIRVRWTERRAELELRKHQLGFDRQLRRARDRATHDPLTKLRNRRYLQDELGPLVVRCRVRKEQLAAVMFDVDNFKQYNDAHGHQAGDTLLEFIGALLRGAIRPTDHAVRYGGDEFLLLLPDADAGQAVAIADRLIKLFGQHARQLGRDHSLSLSAGVAALRAGTPDSEHDLVAQADTALYAAKRKGKNTVVAAGAKQEAVRSAVS